MQAIIITLKQYSFSFAYDITMGDGWIKTGSAIIGFYGFWTGKTS